jgi:hypothetical protein
MSWVSVLVKPRVVLRDGALVIAWIRAFSSIRILQLGLQSCADCAHDFGRPIRQ